MRILRNVHPEAEAMNAAMLYLDQVDDYAKTRFMYHLQHRYFRTGHFIPETPQPSKDRPASEDRRISRIPMGPRMPPEPAAFPCPDSPAQRTIKPDEKQR